MRLFTKLCLLLSLALGLGISAHAEAANPFSFVGFMNNAASWSEGDNTEPYYGFYRFASDGSSGFDAISPIGYDYGWALVTEGGGAATYDDGYFYCFRASGSYSDYSVIFTKLNAKTWQVEKSSSQHYERGDAATIPVPIDITANPVDGKLYAICRPAVGSEAGLLCTVDRETGALTKIADIPNFWTISCDASGQLYALSAHGGGGLYHGGDLYKLNTDGTNEKVGYTGLAMYDKEKSATIDYRSGKMYLSHYGYVMKSDGQPNYSASIKGLYEIDLTDGHATQIFVYPDDAHITGLSIINCHPSAPDIISDLTFAPKEAGSMTGVVTYTVPLVTYAQTPLGGSVTASYYLDNEPVLTETVSPGSNISREIQVSGEGNHTLVVTLKANDHESIPADGTAFFGVDAPAAVTNLLLTASENATRATLTWDAPTESTSGGAFDPSEVRYQIVRYPGKVTVARAATSTTFTEIIDSEYAAISYEVTPYINGDTSKRGKSVRSNKVFLGSPRQLPYAESFDSADAWDSITVIDANGDGGNWEWEDPVWKFDPAYYCAFFYHSIYAGAADDWFVSPKLALEYGKLYKITYQAYGYYDQKGNDFEVYSGSTPTVEGMKTLISKESIFNKNYNDRAAITTLFAPGEGDQYVGFRNITQEPNHLSIDNILIEEIGKSSVPAQVTDLKAEIENRTEGKVKLSFKAPENDASGKKLSASMTVKIYHGTDANPFITKANLKPGEAVTLTDDAASPAVNIYRIVPENESGVGLESSISIDLSAGIPVKPQNVTATLTGTNQAVITWDAPTAKVDELGNAIDTESLRYLVYRPMGNNEYDLIGRGLKECTFIDDNPRAQNGEAQAAFSYYVACVNGDGESVAAPSNVIYVGNPYKLPFSETWKEQIAANNPWLQSSNGTASWYPSATGYSPRCEGQDGWGMMSLELGYQCTEGSAVLWSPKIDLSSVKDAKLTLYIYGESSYTDKDFISLAIAADNGEPERITSATYFPKDWTGWKQQTVDLSSFAGKREVQLLLLGNISSATADERRIHIDNIQFSGNTVDKEVCLTSFTGPSQLREGETGTYKVEVKNLGTSDCEALPVTLSVDGTKVASANTKYLSAGESEVVEISYTPAAGIDDVVELLAEIDPKAGSDTNENNNANFLTVSVLPLNLPYVTDLKGAFSPESGEVKLEWGFPSEAEFTEVIVDGAENYDPFIISEIGCWTLCDKDNNLPFKFQDPTTGQLIKWENNDVPQAWMIFRPSDVTSDRTFQVHEGLQTFISWSNADVSGSGVGNDDWLISPLLPGDNQLLSFYVRRLNERDTKEEYNVLISSTDTDPASFKRLNGDTPLLAPAEWELKYFALPEGTKYFAIQYVGYHQSALLVDDIQFEAFPTHLRPEGFNIYRNGEKLNASPTTRKSYTDTKPASGTSTYVVRPIYYGIEAPASNELVITSTGIAGVGNGEVSVIAGKGFIRIANAAGRNLEVFNIDGTRMASRTVASDSEIISAPTGIYVVKAGDACFKVIVK